MIGGTVPDGNPRTVKDDLARIVVGGSKACGFSRTGGVWCWPSNARFDTVVPTRVMGSSSDTRTLAAGDDHVCAATEIGRVYCWGANDARQLGDAGGTPSLSGIVQVVGIVGITSLVAGADLTCANYEGKPPVCWGTTSVRPSRTPTGALARPSMIGLGADWTVDTISETRICAHTTAEGRCFGPDGPAEPFTPSKRDLRSAVGTTSECAVGGENDTALCSGTAPSSPVPSDDLKEPTLIPGADHVREMATNGTTYCARTTSASFVCWGAPAQSGTTVWAGLTVSGINADLDAVGTP